METKLKIKKCAQCNGEFFYQRSTKMYCSDVCKWTANNLRRPQGWSKMWRYKLTEQQLLDITANGCEICGSFDDLHIDHDHSCCDSEKTCGKCIRGVLCGPHNRALGVFKDNVDHLIAAAAYLVKNENKLGEVSNGI